MFLINDEPTLLDLMQFQDNYVEPIADIVVNPETQTPLTVGILGEWGSGKTTLLGLIERYVQQQHPTNRHVWFNPWVYQTEDNLLIPLLHTLYDEFETEMGDDIKKRFRRILQVVGRISANALMKTITLDQVDLEQLDKEIDNFNRISQQATSELRNLRKTLKATIDTILGDDAGSRLMIYIDDLDRCLPQKIISMLEAMKLFLNIERTVVFIAMDKSVIQQGIQLYFSNFSFSKEKIHSITGDYLDKMIQLPLYLYPISTGQIEVYLRQLNLPSLILDHLDLFITCLHPNPRKIKRVINNFLLLVGIIERSGRDDLDIRMLGKLILLQQQWNELYSGILSYPNILTHLDAVYAGTRDLYDEHHWSSIENEQEREMLLQFCRRFYHQQGSLTNLFNYEPRFSDVDIYQYLYLLG